MQSKYSLKTLRDTTLKLRPVDPSQLAATEKNPLPGNHTYPVHSFLYDQASDHLKVAFLLNSFQKRNTWFVRSDDVQLFDQGQPLTFKTTPAAPQPVQELNLPIPYHSQLDNDYNPTGSCNVTSLAMCLSYLGLKSKDANEQLEDEFYRYCLDKGYSRHDPYDLARVVRDYGYKDDFQADAKWEDVKAWLIKRNPIVVHGYFTSFGHIVVIRGFNKHGWIVNDPYGEWFDWGYDTNSSGESLTYSYSMMKRICGNNGDLWIHYISK